MRHLRFLIFCLILPLAAMATTACAQESNTYSVDCIISISADPSIIDTSPMNLDMLMNMALSQAHEATEGDVRSSGCGVSDGTIHLVVTAPTEAGAKDFLNRVGRAFHQILNRPYEAHADQLSESILSLEVNCEMAQRQVEALLGRSPEGRTAPPELRQPLEAVVDLSMWSPDMPFAEALDILKNSVDPPLQIVPMWKDLHESLGVVPEDLVRIDGLPFVKVETALELLLEAMSTSGYELGYRIKDNVIVIEPAEELAPVTGPVSQADVEELQQQRGRIVREIQTLELDQASLEARRQAIEEQIDRAYAEVQRELADDTVTKELEKLVQLQEVALARQQQLIEYGQASESALAGTQESLAKAKIELARRQEELTRSSSGGRLTNLSGQLSQIAIDRAEKSARLEVLRRHLASVETELSQIAAFEAQAAQIASAKMTVAALSQKLAELKTEQASLRRPLVTMIGPN